MNVAEFKAILSRLPDNLEIKLAVGDARELLTNQDFKIFDNHGAEFVIGPLVAAGLQDSEGFSTDNKEIEGWLRDAISALEEAESEVSDAVSDLQFHLRKLRSKR